MAAASADQQNASQHCTPLRRLPGFLNKPAGRSLGQADARRPRAGGGGLVPPESSTSKLPIHVCITSALLTDDVDWKTHFLLPDLWAIVASYCGCPRPFSGDVPFSQHEGLTEWAAVDRFALVHHALYQLLQATWQWRTVYGLSRGTGSQGGHALLSAALLQKVRGVFNVVSKNLTVEYPEPEQHQQLSKQDQWMLALLPDPVICCTKLVCTACWPKGSHSKWCQAGACSMAPEVRALYARLRRTTNHHVKHQPRAFVTGMNWEQDVACLLAHWTKDIEEAVVAVLTHFRMRLQNLQSGPLAPHHTWCVPRIRIMHKVEHDLAHITAIWRVLERELAVLHTNVVLRLVPMDVWPQAREDTLTEHHKPQLEHMWRAIETWTVANMVLKDNRPSPVVSVEQGDGSHHLYMPAIITRPARLSSSHHAKLWHWSIECPWCVEVRTNARHPLKTQTKDTLNRVEAVPLCMRLRNVSAVFLSEKPVPTAAAAPVAPAVGDSVVAARGSNGTPATTSAPDDDDDTNNDLVLRPVCRPRKRARAGLPTDTPYREPFAPNGW